MPEAAHPTPHPVVLIADAERGPQVARLLNERPEFQLVAITGPAGKQLADAYAVPFVDDQRVMITQHRPAALIIAEAPRTARELFPMLAQYHLGVWRLPPPGRSFSEVGTLLEASASLERPAQTFSAWTHTKEAIRSAVTRLDDFAYRYSELCIRAPGPETASWRSGRVEAGGGVLAQDAFDLLEGLIAARGLPDRVSAATLNVRRRPDTAPRETEDAAIAILHYEPNGIALIRALWDIEPRQQSLTHHGATQSITITPEKVVASDAQGIVLSEATWSTAEEAFITLAARDLEHFATRLTDETPESRAAAARQDALHLAVAAVLDATYLSARTGHPESPGKLYEVQGWPAPTW